MPMKQAARIASIGFMPLTIRLPIRRLKVPAGCRQTVDAACQDDKGHTERNKGVDGNLTQQVFQVIGIDKTVV